MAPRPGTKFVTAQTRPAAPSHREHPDLLAVVDLCARRRAESLVLFETLGGWTRSDDSYVALTSPDDPFSRGDPVASAVRRRFASAAHRHAWHAELWAARMPLIPGVDVLDRTATARAQINTEDLKSGDAVSRRLVYFLRLRTIVTELDDIAGGIDADLDPATTRVIDLVRTDLIGLSDGRF